MSHADFNKSKRLQKVYQCLLSGPKTTREIINLTGVCAVNSIVHELRQNNIDIHCKLIKRTKESAIYQYTLNNLF